MADPTIFRYEVPVDDQWHTLELTGQVLHVAARRPEVVEFWASANDRLGPATRRRLRVFGTGQPLPSSLTFMGDLRHVGTALATDGQLVWHLVEDVGEGSSGDG